MVVVSFTWFGNEDTEGVSPWARYMLLLVIFNHDVSCYIFDVFPSFLDDDGLDCIGPCGLIWFEGTNGFFKPIGAVDFVEEFIGYWVGVFGGWRWRVVGVILEVDVRHDVEGFFCVLGKGAVWFVDCFKFFCFVV